MATLRSRIQALEDDAPRLGHELTPLHRFYGEPDPPGYKLTYWFGPRTLADFYGDNAPSATATPSAARPG